MTLTTDDHNLRIWRRALVLAAELILLMGILIVAADLRLANVAENPAWYSDETTHIDIARNLVNGEMRYMAVKDSTLLFGRVPLFHVLLAWQYRLNPDADPILVLRTFTGMLGVFCVMLMYVAVRFSRDGFLALMAAFALAIFPQAIIYSRFGFSYNLLTVWMLLALLGLTKFAQTRGAAWLVLASLAVGLATVTEVAGFILLAPLLLVVIFIARRPRELVWSLPLALLPFTIYAMLMLLAAPDAFSYDLAFTLSRLGGNPPLPIDGQFANLIHNYTILVNDSLWMPLGFAGLFFIRPLRLAAASLLLFWIPFISIGRGFALYSLSAYYLIPLLPFIALGAASLVHFASLNLWRVSLDSLRGLPVAVRYALAVVVSGFALALFVALPLQPSIEATFQATDSGFPTPIDPFLMDTRDARAIAIFINARSQPDDIVIASPVVAWQFNTRVADFQMTAAAAGNTTPHLPGDLPVERWAFPMAYKDARYIVVDNLWYNWGVVHVPGLADMVREVETWPQVFQAGDLRVYANPALN